MQTWEACKKKNNFITTVTITISRCFFSEHSHAETPYLRGETASVRMKIRRRYCEFSYRNLSEKNLFGALKRAIHARFPAFILCGRFSRTSRSRAFEIRRRLRPAQKKGMKKRREISSTAFFHAGPPSFRQEEDVSAENASLRPWLCFRSRCSGTPAFHDPSA